jgi:membrane-associated phospholipid phosphatase
MSMVGGIGRGGALGSRLRQLDANVRGAVATLLRPPRSTMPWPAPGRLAVATLVAAVAVYVTMLALDLPLLHATRRLPAAVIDAFNEFTDLGKSGWFLWPTGLLLLALALFDSPALPRSARGTLAAFAVRLGFVFTAVAVPGLFVTIVKRLIGRARPFVVGEDVWAYLPFSWRVEYASLPSGHATTAFSALVAIGALYPPARALMWTYAVAIAASRVIITTHHPSDVLAGAIVGALGALLVRQWFAARRLGFRIAADGTVQPMPGPTWRRIVKAVAQRRTSA